MAIKLIVGLGNPGEKYTKTRHNVGFWLSEQLAIPNQFKSESKFFGEIVKTSLGGCVCWLLKPTTFMNESGRSVSALANFYKIVPQDVLVLHDELDLAAGQIRLKISGGHGGHNGLKDIIDHFGSRDFYRLRIGIGHPGNTKEVTNYVLKPPIKIEKDLIEDAIYSVRPLITQIMNKELQAVMNKLHRKE